MIRTAIDQKISMNARFCFLYIIYTVTTDTLRPLEKSEVNFDLCLKIPMMQNVVFINNCPLSTDIILS